MGTKRERVPEKAKLYGHLGRHGGRGKRCAAVHASFFRRTGPIRRMRRGFPCLADERACRARNAAVRTANSLRAVPAGLSGCSPDSGFVRLPDIRPSVVREIPPGHTVGTQGDRPVPVPSDTKKVGTFLSRLSPVDRFRRLTEVVFVRRTLVSI